MNIARNLLLAASTNAWLRERAMRVAFVRRSVSRFMPGERVEDAVAAAARLRTQGIGAILTHLGENLTRVDEAEGVTRHYLDVLDLVKAGGLDAQISVKPTQLGCDLDADLCFRNLQRLVDRAADLDNFVWIDMESSRYVDATLDLFRRTRLRSPRIGVALQAYLLRTAQDVEALLPLEPAIRLVKGAYLEPPGIAYQKKADVDESFFRLACRLSGQVGSVGQVGQVAQVGNDVRRAAMRLHIATHDRRLIERVNAFIAEYRIPASAYEYAMLFGIQRPLQLQLVEEGRRVRVLISYGRDWFPWYMRRLAERPANLWFVLKNLSSTA